MYVCMYDPTDFVFRGGRAGPKSPAALVDDMSGCGQSCARSG